MRLILRGTIFIMGILYCMYGSNELREGFNSNEECPNLLVQ